MKLRCYPRATGQALYSYGKTLDTDPEKDFDDIRQLASSDLRGHIKSLRQSS